jgi:hypothetical protein
MPVQGPATSLSPLAIARGKINTKNFQVKVNTTKQTLERF